MKHSKFTSPIRILAIAPYEGLKDSILRVAANFPEAEIHAVTGNLEEGVRLAQENFHSNYDVIISRGGTANLLKEQVDLPVKEIPISVYDILQAVQTANQYFHKTAIVGFSNITENARQVVNLLNLDMEIFTIYKIGDIHSILKQLEKDAFQTIICDVISASYAREAGFDTILITSGTDSIQKALQDAIEEMEDRQALREENAFLRKMLSDHSGDIVIYREDDSLYFSSMGNDSSDLLNFLKDELEEVRSGSTTRLLRNLNGFVYTIKASVSSYTDRDYVTYFINRSRATGISRHSGIFFYDRKEVGEAYEGSFFQLSGELNPIRSEINAALNSNKPLLITGEYGTGRTGTAQYYYLNGTNSKHPLIEIDCQMLNERGRDFLMNHQRSPLFSTGNTVHFKNMEFNSDSFMKELLSVLVHVDFCTHNTVVFSCSTDGEVIKNHIAYLKDKFQCLQAELAPLRYNRERIPAIVNLYFSQLSANGRISYMRMEDKALDYLEAYSWPGNYVQLERILTQLSEMSEEHLIRLEQVQNILRYETIPESGLLSPAASIDFRQSLAQMEKEIVYHVLKECDNNQSAAAKRLGISRTTLWRILKEQE